MGKAMEHMAEKSEGDLALTRAAGNGDERARRILADLLLNRVRSTVSYLAWGDPDSEDMIQVSLVEILRSAKTYKGDGRLTAWADRITVRTTMRMIRKRASREETLAAEDAAHVADTKVLPEGPLSFDPLESQEQITDRHKLRLRLILLLQRLSPERKLSVVLRWVCGYSLEEIAEITGTPVNTVRDRLQVGRKQLIKAAKKDPVLVDWGMGMGGEG